MKEMMGLMKKAQEMQARMGQAQAELETATVVGQAAGGAVKITLTAAGAMRAISIDPALVKPDEADMLEDLILTAHDDARRKGVALAEEKMRAATAGMPLPPGMKLPF